jgi:hypothetical protein
MKLLTPEQLLQLADGTAITVTWYGGNGPHSYVLKWDGDIAYACVPIGHDFRRVEALCADGHGYCTNNSNGNMGLWPLSC